MEAARAARVENNCLLLVSYSYDFGFTPGRPGKKLYRIFLSSINVRKLSELILLA